MLVVEFLMDPVRVCCICSSLSSDGTMEELTMAAKKKDYVSIADIHCVVALLQVETYVALVHG